MAFSTVNDAFTEVLKRIELNPARVTLASQRYNAVKTTIENALPGKTVSQIGSFQRKTKIRPADLGDALDIDAVVNFKRFTSTREQDRLDQTIAQLNRLERLGSNRDRPEFPPRK